MNPFIPNIVWTQIPDDDMPTYETRILVPNEELAFDRDLPAALVITLRYCGTDRGLQVGEAYFDWCCQYEDNPFDVPATTSVGSFTVKPCSDLNIAWYHAMLHAVGTILGDHLADISAIKVTDN